MQQDRSSERARRIKGIAGIMVVAGALSLSSTALTSLSPALGNPLHLGTDLFLMLSGLLLCASAASGGSGTALIVRRIVRLLPMIAVAAGIAALTMAAFGVLPSTPWAQGFFTVDGGTLWSALLRLLSGSAFGEPSLPFLLGGIWIIDTVLLWSLAGGLVMMLRPAPGAAAATLVRIGLGIALLGAGLRLAAGSGIAIGVLEVVVDGRFDVMAAGIAAFGARDGLGRWAGGHPGASLLLMLAGLVVLCVTGGGNAPGLVPALGTILSIVCVLPLTLSAFADRAPTGGALAWIGDRALAGLALLKPAMALAWLALFNISVTLVESPWLYAVGQAVMTLAILVPASALVHGLVERPLRLLAAALAPAR